MCYRSCGGDDPASERTVSNQDINQNNEDNPARDKREQRAMWIFSAVIVLLILGGMGANMLFHHEQPAGGTDISSQSRNPSAK
jgi:hypothetical protein